MWLIKREAPRSRSVSPASVASVKKPPAAPPNIRPLLSRVGFGKLPVKGE